MKIVSYLSSVPARNNNQQKTDLLNFFIQGVQKIGDTGLIHTGNNILDCDVAVIQGWVYNQLTTPHLKLRNDIIKYQKLKKKHVCIADANLFLYANKTNPLGYLRYSFDGVFPSTGIYFDNDPDPSRWEKISKDTGIVLEDKKQGKHILICAQRNGGWSMADKSMVSWVENTVEIIKKYTDRKIILRPHPGDKTVNSYIKNPKILELVKQKKLIISSIGTPLEVDLIDCHAVVNHNSSSIVGPIIQGYSAFITDSKNSQCSDVADTDFSNIENPKSFDRLKWLQRISMFHWKFSELEDGTAWRHMRNYVRQ